MAIQRRISKARNRKLIGSEASILVEGVSEETDLLWQGRMSTQAPEIDGVTLINDFEGDEPRAGQIRTLRVTEAHDYDLVGTLLPSAAIELENFDLPPAGLVHIQPAPSFVVPGLIPAR